MHKRYSSFLLYASLGPQPSHLWDGTTHSNPGFKGRWKELSEVTDSRTENGTRGRQPQPSTTLPCSHTWASLFPKLLSARDSTACWKMLYPQGLGKAESTVTQLPQPFRHHTLSSPPGSISLHPLGLSFQSLCPCSPWASFTTALSMGIVPTLCGMARLQS